MSGQDYETIRLDFEGQTGWLTIDRADKLNALSLTAVRELRRGLMVCEENDDIQVVGVRGAGSKAFSAGADVSEFAERDAPEQMNYIDEVYGLYNKIDYASTPVVAVVDGVAFGGGAELALSCDVRVATESASFCEAEINIGLIPGTKRLTNLVGEGIAMELCLTGRTVDANEAAELGIFNRVVPEEELDSAVAELIESLESKTSIALELTKDTVLAARNNSVEDATVHNYANFHRAFEAPETQAEIERFLDRERDD